MTTRTALATTTDLDARIAEAEGSAIVVWRGDAVPFLQVPERIARESSRAARERLLTGWVEALEALDPLYAERLERWTAGGPPPSGDLDRPRYPVSESDRWGDLPIHVREQFRAQGSDDVPLRYRDWIDAYYRRLNRDP